MTRFLILDATYFLYRAYHAMPPLSTSDGQPTGAIKGAVSAIQSVVRKNKPTHAVAVFDGPGKTFRHDLYPDYKGNRPHRPSDLSLQFHPLMCILEAMGIAVVCAEGFHVEADDIIGTFAKLGVAHGFTEIRIATGDKDMAQLVNENVQLVNPYSEKYPVTGVAEVHEKFGVAPHQIADFLAIIGDVVDNIIGMQGVGTKKAAKWLVQFGDLEGVIAHAAEISERWRDDLLNSVEKLRLNARLTTIRCDVELPYNVLDFTVKPFDVERLISIFDDLEFNDSVLRN